MVASAVGGASGKAGLTGDDKRFAVNAGLDRPDR